MKATVRGKVNNIVLAFFCLIVAIWIIGHTVSMRFWHYDSQYRLLNPEHYNVEVITEEDHKQLANPGNRTVTLSNGTTLTKGDIWDSRVLPNYKSVNNDSQHVLVTVRGTAPFMDEWYVNVGPIFIICMMGLLWGIKRKRLEEPQKIDVLEEKSELNQAGIG